MNFDEHDVEAPDDDSPSPQKPRYRECLKNHAVSLGAHAVDGCGEFMPAGDDGTLDALRCAACSCHRNFHRKDTSGGIGGAGSTPYYRAPVGYLLHHQQVQPHQQRPLALPSTSGAHSDELSEPMEPTADQGIGGGSRKRFRTKFTADQKEKMLQFADRVGWRIQKHNEELVQQLCDETGVKRHVLKVWMHNNKNTLGKKP